MKLTLTSLLVATLIVGSLADQQCQCGIERDSDKIIHGRNAKTNKYPWMTFLTMSLPNGMAACGGTIINDRFIMTAAHCVNETTESGIRVYLTHRKPGFFAMLFGIGAIGVKKIHVHPDYNNNSFDDIALLELNNRFVFKDDFGPVCLPSFTEIDEQSDLTAIGWGALNPLIKITPSQLQETELEYVPFEKCKASLLGQLTKSEFELDDDLLICAGSGKTNICSGDSGGPLFTHKEGKAYQMGISSFALIDCGYLTDTPAAFTRVTAHLSWIKEVTSTTGAKWCSGSLQAIN